MKDKRNTLSYHFLIILFGFLCSVLANSAYADKKTIGILVYDGVLSSDVTAPAEVFGVATKKAWFTDYEVKMISVNNQPFIMTEEGLRINVDSHIGLPQQLTVLIVPSAYKMKPLINNKALIDFIQQQGKQATWLASNCSGALLLAESGFLDGKNATTWAGGETNFQKNYPSVLVQNDKNYVIADNIITSNGGVVSYVSAIKLLSLMSSEKLAKQVFATLQINRLVSYNELMRNYK
jgi:transcriptional regulator GlxA family with amidase domain